MFRGSRQPILSLTSNFTRIHHDYRARPGFVVDRKQGWYRVQLAGTDGVKSFRWAELKEIETSSPPRPTATQSQTKSQSPSPLKTIAPSEPPAAVLVPAVEEVVVAGASSSTKPAAAGLPPRHPGSTMSAAVPGDKESMGRQKEPVSCF